MKGLNKLFSFILAFVMISCCTLSANAYIIYGEYGDVDRDLDVDIFDATYLQRYLAGLESVVDDAYEACDVDADGNISVIDATFIQRYLARMISGFPAGGGYEVYDIIYDIMVDCDSGKAMVGIPVDFIVYGLVQPGPATIKLLVDDVCVAEDVQTGSDIFDHRISYTFEQAGTYDVKVCLYDKIGKSEQILPIKDYVVVEQPLDKTKPIVTSVIANTSITWTPEFTARAVFGTAPYEYKFVLINNGEIVQTQEFSEDNTFLVEELPEYAKAIIQVTVRDANGYEATDDTVYMMWIPLPGCAKPE
ncbi:MAG: dockerin type I repeat-containing protein [Ruminococcus sp.]|nr:dockerin type I repeat-containing protein [Ruminococcus sp.]